MLLGSLAAAEMGIRVYFHAYMCMLWQVSQMKVLISYNISTFCFICVPYLHPVSVRKMFGPLRQMIETESIPRNCGSQLDAASVSSPCSSRMSPIENSSPEGEDIRLETRDVKLEEEDARPKGDDERSEDEDVEPLSTAIHSNNLKQCFEKAGVLFLSNFAFKMA